MSIQETVNTNFDGFIKKTFGPKPAMESFLLNHPKLGMVKENLTGEIKKVEIAKPHLIDGEKIKWISTEAARSFCHKAIMAKEKELVSEAETQRRRHEEHQFNEIQEFLEKNSQGFTEGLDGTRKED